MQKNKLQFIEGIVDIPPNHDLNRKQWKRCNYLIHSWLSKSVSEQIASIIVFHINAIDVWTDLKERFSKPDWVRVFILRSSISSLKQASKSVMDYFSELKGLREEMNEYRSFLVCSCIHQCRCLTMQNVRAYRHEDQVMEFLTGLTD